MKPVVALGCVLSVLALAACPMPPVTPSTLPDASEESAADTGVADSGATLLPDDVQVESVKLPECKGACVVLTKLGCPESKKPDSGLSCYDLCVQATESKKFDLKPKCIAIAKTVEAVRACGTVKCFKIEQ